MLPVISILVACFAFSTPVHAAQTVPYKVNFQGRLTNASGTVLAGTYDMQFKLYTAVTGGTLIWSETRTVVNSNAVTVTNGLFSVLIGEGTAVAGSSATLQAAITANTTMYMEVMVGSETLSPRSQFGSAAYAINADMIDGIDGASLAQIGVTNAWTAAQNITAASTNAFQVKNGSTNLFNVDTTASQVVVGTSDTTGALLVLDTKTSAGDPTGTNGAMYYNSNTGKLRCYQNSAWADCITTVTTTLQDAYDNSSTPATITTSAAGKGIAIAAGAIPTADLLSITNAGQGVTAAGVNGLSVNYVGGAANVEASGMRVDFAPGGTSGGKWSGLRIVANATGAASGVTAYGIKLEGPSSQGAGTEEAMYIGTGWDIGVDIQSGGIQLAAQNDPSTPAASNLRIYAKDIAGRVMPKWVGPSGVDTPIQASLGFNRVSMIMPAGGSTGTTFVGGFGSTFTNAATTYANPTPLSTNLLTSTRRATFATSGTAGQVTSHRQSTLQVWRGNAAGLGGFFYTIRFGTSGLQSGNRAFVGLSGSTAAPTNINPFTDGTISRVGVAIIANTGNWYFVNNAAGSTPTTLDLGSNLPVSATNLYELVLFSPPNGSYIGYRLKNLTTNNDVSGSVSTNLPSNTTFLAPQFWMTNNATAGIVTMDFGGWYLESDQ